MQRFLVAACLMLLSVEAQLRPRRVGVGSMGEQATPDAEPSAAAANPLEDALGQMGGLDALGQMGGLDALSGLADGANPMEALTEMMQNLAASNPEAQEMMEQMGKMAANPELLQEKMQEAMQMMNSEDGSKIMQEVQSVLTDPDKMRQGLEQFATNPMLKQMADKIPGLKQVLDDPEAMEKSIAEAQNALREMGGLEGMQEKMSEVFSGLANMKGGDMDGLLGGLDGLGGNAGEMLEALKNGEGGDDLQARVREQLAEMLRSRGGGGEEAAVDMDEF